MQDYAWLDLSKLGPYSTTVYALGYTTWDLKVSVSGMETDDALLVLMDGIPLPWKSTKLLDRSFYEWHSTTSLAPGSHNLTILTPSPRAAPIRQLCSLSLQE
jgi:hypothetical protein